MRWRLGGRPYAALVLAGDAWDALAWTDKGGAPVTVNGIDVIYNSSVVETIVPTNATAARLAPRMTQYDG